METVLYKRHPVFQHLFASCDGHVFSLKSGRFLKSMSTSGRPYVVTGSRKSAFVHRLVWEAHVGEIPKDFVVNHINADKKDNRLINLETVTQSQNVAHAVNLSLYPKRHGSKNDNAKLTEAEVVLILGRRGEQCTAIARDFGVSRCAVSDIMRGTKWTHVKR